eukprot:6210306-Pleurochrysis_carterae.AAC.1
MKTEEQLTVKPPERQKVGEIKTDEVEPENERQNTINPGTSVNDVLYPRFHTKAQAAVTFTHH